MAHWTTHTRYTFHAENCTGISATELASEIEYREGICVMVKDYLGVWDGQVTEGYEVTWISPSPNDEEDYDFASLNHTVKMLTGNRCLMPVREKIEVFCECD